MRVQLFGTCLVYTLEARHHRDAVIHALEAVMADGQVVRL